MRCSFPVITHNSTYDNLTMLCWLKSFQTGSRYCFSLHPNVFHFQQAAVIAFIPNLMLVLVPIIYYLQFSQKVWLPFLYIKLCLSINEQFSIDSFHDSGKVISGFSLISIRPHSNTPIMIVCAKMLLFLVEQLTNTMKLYWAIWKSMKLESFPKWYLFFSPDIKSLLYFPTAIITPKDLWGNFIFLRICF